MLVQIEPFYSWHTPIAWTGFILFADGVVWKRRARSWVNDAPAEFIFLAIVSVPLWVIFELYNKYTLHNWYYLGLPDSLLIRHIGYAWSFATISPAIFETGDLIRAFAAHAIRCAPRCRSPSLAASGSAWSPGGDADAADRSSVNLSRGAGVAGIHPARGSDQRARGDESILGDLRDRRYGRLVNLLLSGLVCGLIWECWNYEAGTKWKYNVPILPEVKVFEMPILGFAGFPPFAVECFVMYVFVRRRLWRGATYAISV